jgi:hypothetical protein
MIDAYFPIIFDFHSKKTETAAPPEPENEPKALNFLTQEDWRLLVEKSSLESYPQGKEILAKGAQRRAIFIIEQGVVRVEREPGSVIARRGPGVVFGEMSFLENKGASAAVIADSDVERVGDRRGVSLRAAGFCAGAGDSFLSNFSRHPGPPAARSVGATSAAISFAGLQGFEGFDVMRKA